MCTSFQSSTSLSFLVNIFLLLLLISILVLYMNYSPASFLSNNTRPTHLKFHFSSMKPSLFLYALRTNLSINATLERDEISSDISIFTDLISITIFTSFNVVLETALTFCTLIICFFKILTANYVWLICLICRKFHDPDWLIQKCRNL